MLEVVDVVEEAVGEVGEEGVQLLWKITVLAQMVQIQSRAGHLSHQRPAPPPNLKVKNIYQFQGHADHAQFG